MFRKTIASSLLIASASAYHRHHYYGNRLMQAHSVPACTSLGCNKESAAKAPTDTLPLPEPTRDNWGKMDSDWGINHAKNFADLFQRESVPACTSLGCKKDSLAKPPTDTVPLTDNWGKVDSDWGVYHAKNYADLVQRDSIPACTSYECKTDSIAKPPSNTATTANWGKDNVDWGAHHDGIYSGEADVVTGSSGIRSQMSSRPACDSTGCKTETAAALGWEDALSTGVGGGSAQDSAIVNSVIDSFRLSQQRSVPACTSLGCKKESAAKAPTDTLPLPEPTRDNWGKMDSDWGINHAKDYVDVQLESGSIPSCNSFECFTGTAAQPFHSEKPDKHPVNYFVPNFGTDKETLSDASNLKESEAKYGPWDLKKKEKETETNYKVPNFGVDQDIAESLQSEKSSSDLLGHKWVAEQKTE